MTDLPAAIRALPPAPPSSLALVAETPLYLAGYRDGHRAARKAAAGLAARPAGEVTYEVDGVSDIDTPSFDSLVSARACREKARKFGWDASVVEVTRRAVGGGTAGE